MNFLVTLARRAIKHYLETSEYLEIAPSEAPKEFIEIGACFVTLTKNGELRGCIGSLEAHRPLVFDLIDNAVSSAVNDPRFYPLVLEELDQTEIEVSVLSKPIKVEISSKKELLGKLVPGETGLIIKKGWNRATFLPSVWEDLPEKEEFLSHLCLKAGLFGDQWKNPEGMEFYFYKTTLFRES